MTNNNGNNSRGSGGDKSRPVEKVRLGVIQAAIWRNETDKGAMYNVTLERSFRDRNTEEWRSTHSFGRDDLPIVEKVAAKAYARIHALQQADRRTAQEAAEGAARDDNDGAEPERTTHYVNGPAPQEPAASSGGGKAARAKTKSRDGR